MTSNRPQAAAAMSPLAIATHFIKQYYFILSSNNPSIHKFYRGESHISFSPSSNTPAISQTISNLENVEEKFAWAANSCVDFANGSIDAQESVDGGILVVVTGEIFLEGKDDKKLFVQTFFLKDAGRGASRRNYFVFNDVFRFLERETKVEPPKVVAVVKEIEEVQKDDAPTSKIIVTASQQINGTDHSDTSEALVELAPETVILDSDDVENTDKNCEAEEDVTDVVSEDESNLEPDEGIENSVEKPHQEIAADASKSHESKTTHKSKPPGSWASLVAGSSSKIPTSIVDAPTPAAVKPSPKKEKDSNHSVSTTATERTKRPSRPQEAETEPIPTGNSGTVGARSSGYGSKGSSSLYIKNVEEGISESDLKDLFSEFPFKIVNVSFYPSRGYAFVDFADADAVNSIMKENRQTFHINGRPIEVEKKSSVRRRGGGNSGGSGNGSRGGSGNQRINSKGQHQRSHSDRRLNGGGRKGRAGGGDKKRDFATNTGSNSSN